MDYWWWNEWNIWSFMVSSHGSTSWQLRRVTSRLGARPGGFAVLNKCGEDACLSVHMTYCFVNLGTSRFNITANFASVDVYGRMKELVVLWWSSSHFGVLNLTAGSPSVGGKGGWRYWIMRTHCLRLRMLRGQRRTHIYRNRLHYFPWICWQSYTQSSSWEYCSMD